MSVFEGEVLNQTIGVAVAHHIEPAALLAVVEVESAGKSLESDGRTPCFLFERHIFYRELKKAGKTQALELAVEQGLANSSWQPSTQYKDQGSSSNRLKLLARAKFIDEECALRSCSWGVGQTMGFLAEELKFPNAKAMVDYQIKGGVPAQVECMIREIENKKLGPKLNSHDWAGFARVYNGPGYAKNNYVSKMVSAWNSWKGRGVNTTTVQPPKPVPVPGPVGPVKPGPTVPPVATGGGIIAIIVAAWAAIHNNLSIQLMIFGGFILVLAIVTLIVIWKRALQANLPKQGNLASVRKD